MNREERGLLEFVINAREKEILQLMNYRNILSLFERFPVLLSAIIIRRRDPSISLIVVASGAHRLHPFFDLLRTPIYADLGNLHPFARLVASSQEERNLEETTYLCWLEIRRAYDKNTYLVFLRLLLEALFSNDPIPLIDSHGREMASIDSQKYLPLTEDILNIYSSFYEKLEMDNEEAALIFLHHLKDLILSTKRIPQPTYLILKFVKTEAFFEYMKALMKNAIDYVPMPFGLPHTSIHLVSVTHKILLLERIAPTFASLLRSLIFQKREELYFENIFSQQLGRVMVNLFIENGTYSLSSYTESLTLLSQYLSINLSLLLETLFGALSSYPEQKKKLVSFLIGVIENAPTVQGRDIIKTIEEERSLLNSKDRAKLKKIYVKRR